MVIVLWSAIALLFFSYFGFMMLAAIFGHIFKKTKIPKKDEKYLPSVTFIISTFNEEKIIESKIINSLKIDYPKERFQIIVASEATDNTNKIVSSYECENLRLISFIDREGKSATLYRVMPSVESEIIVFSDANSMYREDAIKNLVADFQDRQVGCVIGRLEYLIDGISSGAVGEGLYWSLDMKFRQAISGVKGLVPGVNGSIFAIRRTLYFPLARDRGDDYELCTRIVNKGYLAIFAKDAVAIEHANESNKQQFNRKLRIARWNIKSSVLLCIDAVRELNFRSFFQILLVRGIRYLSPILLLSILIMTYQISKSNQLYLLLLWLQIAFYFTGIFVLFFNGMVKGKILNAIGYFLLMNIAALVAWLTIFKNQTFWVKQR
jgi:cellulose synthase/poly-beta-1,6-N-acetylglucosamine synthase-like glycosyltransferase